MDSLSPTEAEYYAMSHAFKEAPWLRVFICKDEFSDAYIHDYS